jgi:hypothetical protein
VRVRARPLRDGRGVGRRSQQQDKSRHRSSNEGQTMPAPTSPSRGRAEDLSGPPAVGQKTCPATASKHRKTCVVETVVQMDRGPSPRPPITNRLSDTARAGRRCATQSPPPTAGPISGGWPSDSPCEWRLSARSGTPSTPRLRVALSSRVTLLGSLSPIPSGPSKRR